MEKYLGNKSSLLPLIHAFIANRIPEATSLSDLFAGTNNVSRYFRARGWATAACDVNRFSYVLAQAYLGTDEPPAFRAVPRPTSETLLERQIQQEFIRAVDRFGALYLPGQTADIAFADLAPMASVLVSLQIMGDANETPGVVTNYFTQWGTSSQFLSQRGSSGVRNYFSKSNGLFLDGVLNLLRNWWREGILERSEIFLLLASVIEEVVITANVSGTFHDFNRTRIWPNALQPFRLRLPLVSYQGPAAESMNADATSAAGVFRHHDVCYLDPPYNFRQYSAYYHFLNFIAAYPFLEDVDDYVGGLTFVRGQNQEDDFTSDFCFRDRFIPSMRGLIENVDADHVILSYYSGRNHWNHWSEVTVPTDEGLRQIQALFADKELFSNFEVVPALEIRKNYQSRVGEQKGLINEYLFHGTLRGRARQNGAVEVPLLAANSRWGLTDEFCHVRPAAHYPAENGVRAAW